MNKKKSLFILTLITTLKRLIKSDEIVRYYNLGLIYKLEQKVLENEFGFIRRAGDHFTDWKNYHTSIQPKAQNPISNRIIPLDKVVASTSFNTVSLTSNLGNDLYVYFGFVFDLDKNVNKTVLSLIASDSFEIVKEIVVDEDVSLELCSQFLHTRVNAKESNIKIACVKSIQEKNSNEKSQKIILFQLNSTNLKLQSFEMETKVEQTCPLELDQLAAIKLWRVVALERCITNAIKQSNLLFFFDLTEKKEHKYVKLDNEITNLPLFHSIGMHNSALPTSILLSGFEKKSDTGQKKLSLKRCFLNLRSSTMPVSGCVPIELPNFHSNGVSRVVNTETEDFIVYIVFKNLDEVYIGKCLLNSPAIKCKESEFAYTKDVSIRNLGINKKNFVTFEGVFNTDPYRLLLFGAYDDQKLEISIIVHESDSGFMYNDFFIITVDNVLKIFQDPNYHLEINANRLSPGSNSLKLQIKRGPNLYLLTYNIELTDILYDQFDIEANYFVLWEDEYDLVMPINRNLVYGNGLEFKIDQKLKKPAVIFDKNLIHLGINQKGVKYKKIYFFGRLGVGIQEKKTQNGGDPDSQGVSVFNCYRNAYDVFYQCFALITTYECKTDTILYRFKALQNNIIAMRFINKIFDEETTLFFDLETREVKSYNQTLYQSASKTQKAKQLYDELDFIVGSLSIYFVRNFAHNNTVQVKKTFSDPKSKKFSIVINKTKFLKEGDFCPKSVSFDPSGIPSYQILSNCNDIVLLASLSLYPDRFREEIINLIPVYIKDSSFSTKRMCKGLTVNPLWISNTNIIYSVKVNDGGVMNYRMPENVVLNNIVCVPNSDTIIAIARETLQPDTYVILIYSTNPEVSRKKLLFTNIVLEKQDEQPTVMASQIGDSIYVNIEAFQEGKTVYLNYIVYTNGPLIKIPKESLQDFDKINLNLSNWRKTKNYEFKLQRFKDDTPAISQKLNPQKNTLKMDLDPILTGNILNLTLKKPTKDLKISKRLISLGNYSYSTPDENFIDMSFGYNYVVSLKYTNNISTFNITTTENLELAAQRILGICNGLDTSHVNDSLMISSVCNVNDRTQLIMIYYYLGENLGRNQNKAYVINVPLSDYFDEVSLKNFKITDDNNLFYSLILRKNQGQMAVLGIFTFGIQDLVWSYRIIHEFKKSKRKKLKFFS